MMAIKPATTTIFMAEGQRPGRPAEAGERSKPGGRVHGPARVTPVWRRVLPTLATALAIVVFVIAGNWQRGRMQQKDAWAARIAAAEAAPLGPLPAGTVDWEAWRFRTVEAHGTFIAAQQFLLDNKVHRGRAGYHVVTPFRLDDGRVVLVDRGWIPPGPTRAEVPNVPVPAGEVALQGRVNLPPQGYVELAATKPQRGVWQNLDPARFTTATGLPVLPIVIEATLGAGEGLGRDWPRPDSGSVKHLVYMLHWYTFAALAAGLWLWSAVVRPRFGR